MLKTLSHLSPSKTVKNLMGELPENHVCAAFNCWSRNWMNESPVSPFKNSLAFSYKGCGEGCLPNSRVAFSLTISPTYSAYRNIWIAIFELFSGYSLPWYQSWGPQGKSFNLQLTDQMLHRARGSWRILNSMSVLITYLIFCSRVFIIKQNEIM